MAVASKRPEPVDQQVGPFVVSIPMNPKSDPPTPSHRWRRRQMQSQSPPRLISPKLHMGIAGSRITAPGQDATCLATHITTSTPQESEIRANPSRPIGISRMATIAQGMIREAGHWHRDHVGGDAVDLKSVEVIDGVRRRGGPGDERRQTYAGQVDERPATADVCSSGARWRSRMNS